MGSVVRMVNEHDLDHRAYVYPGLFFYALMPAVALVPLGEREGGKPYLYARALIAAGGTASIVAAAWAGLRLVSPAAGLVAALLLAVSPLSVQTAHQVRPDVLLEGLGFVALVVFSRVGARRRDDVLSGALIGVAASLKLTGLFLVPFYVAVRLSRPGERARGLIVAGAVCVGVLLATTPYLLLRAPESLRAPLEEVDNHYRRGADRASGFQGGYYAAQASRALGAVGAVAAVGGFVLLLRRDRLFFGAAALHPLAVFLVMSSARLAFPRMILPGMALPYLALGTAVAALPLPVLVAVVVALEPLSGAIRHARVFRAPLASDVALDHIESLGAGARVLETREEASGGGHGVGQRLGVDPRRQELVDAPFSPEVALLAPFYDLVVLPPNAKDVEHLGLRIVDAPRHTLAPEGWWPFAPLRVGPAAMRLAEPLVRTRSVPIAASVVTSSGDGSSLTDGSRATVWSASPAEGAWVELRFPSPTPVRVLRLVPPLPLPRQTPGLRVLVDGERVPAVSDTPGFEEQARRAARGAPWPLEQRLVLDGTPRTSLRILQRARLEGPWTVAEVIAER